MPRLAGNKKLKRVEGELCLAAVQPELIIFPNSRPPSGNPGVPLKRCSRDVCLQPLEQLMAPPLECSSESHSDVKITASSPVVTSPQGGHGDSMISTPQSGDGNVSFLSTPISPPTPAKQPFQLTFRRYGRRLRSIITNSSTVSSALPTTASAPNRTASPEPIPQTGDDIVVEEQLGLVVTEIPNTSDQDSNSDCMDCGQDDSSDVDPNNNNNNLETMSLVPFPAITEVFSKYKIQSDPNNNNELTTTVEYVDKNDNLVAGPWPTQESGKHLPKSFVALNDNVIPSRSRREFVVMKAKVKAKAEATKGKGPIGKKGGKKAAKVGDTTEETDSLPETSSTDTPQYVHVGPSPGVPIGPYGLPSSSTTYPYPTITKTKTVSSETSESSATDFKGPVPGAYLLDSPSEKGAIRFHLP